MWGVNPKMKGRGSMGDPKPGLIRWARMYGAKVKVIPQKKTNERVTLDSDVSVSSRANEKEATRRKVQASCWWCAFHAVRAGVVQLVCTLL